ncbi:hypothetical protein V8E55_002016 [Tylopilus felleus]
MPSEETKVSPPPTRRIRSSHRTNRSASSRSSSSVVYVVPCVAHGISLTAKQTVLHYGWIPMIIYIGYTRSSPQPMFIKSVSSLSFRIVLTLPIDS